MKKIIVILTIIFAQLRLLSAGGQIIQYAKKANVTVTLLYG